MYKLLGGLKDYLKWQDIVTENAIFRIHNVFTTVLLMTFSLIITANQFVGNPISCIVNGIPTHPVNTYCWITSTFTMPDAIRRQVGQEIAHPGLVNEYGNGPKKYHTYYQWVCFALFFQVRATHSLRKFHIYLVPARLRYYPQLPVLSRFTPLFLSDSNLFNCC